jgi:methylmalonyl-CoA/ethylmalonyl-CoA epimerase
MSGILGDVIIGIDHIGICVGNLESSAELWAELLGLAIAHRECIDVQKAEAAFVDFAGQPSTVELVAPMPGNAGLVRFLGQRGDGLHHLAFGVTDIRLALARLAGAGLPLIDREPRPGARGHLVAFLHPKAMNGTLVELVEHGRQA